MTRSLHWIAWSLLLVLAWGVGAAADDGDASDPLLEARRAIAAGELRRALTHLEAAIQAAPSSPEPRLLAGEVLLSIAKTNIAGGGMGRTVQPFLRDALDTLASLDVTPKGGLAPAWRARLAPARAEAHFLLGELAPALETLAAAEIGTLPEAARAACHDLAARVHYAAGRYDDAAASFEQAGNPLAAASAYDAARKPEKSMPLYAQAIHAAPGDGALLERALTAVRYHRSHRTLLAALEDVATPEGTAGLPLLRARAELLEGSGRIDEAIGLLQDAAARDEASADALVGLGRLWGLKAMSGDAVDQDALDRAADAYIAAIRRVPEDEAAAAGLSWLASQDYTRLWKAWRDERITGRCLRVQQALVEAVPDDAWAWGNLGNTLRVLGRHDAALEAYTRAREANPYDPAILSDRGLALSGAGRATEALEAFEASVTLDGGHLSGRQNAARMLYLRGRLEAAAAHLGAAARTSRAVGGSPGTYRFLLDRVWRAGRRSDLR